MTNADKYFRNATDEEIADFAMDRLFGCYTIPIDECFKDGVCRECWLDWLKQEAPDTPQKEPLCLSCAHASISVTDDFADCLCKISGGYEGGKTECKDYERRSED